jgi:hypothetical protein
VAENLRGVGLAGERKEQPAAEGRGVGVRRSGIAVVEISYTGAEGASSQTPGEKKEEAEGEPCEEVERPARCAAGSWMGLGGRGCDGRAQGRKWGLGDVWGPGHCGKD